MEVYKANCNLDHHWRVGRVEAPYGCWENVASSTSGKCGHKKPQKGQTKWIRVGRVCQPQEVFPLGKNAKWEPHSKERRPGHRVNSVKECTDGQTEENAVPSGLWKKKRRR